MKKRTPELLNYSTFTYQFFRHEGSIALPTIGLPGLTLLSANTWETCFTQLENLDSTTRFAITPELITTTGISLTDIPQNLTLIQDRIRKVLDISKQNLHVKIILGTPHFTTKRRPFNSSLVIQSGQISQVINKRAPAIAREKSIFQFDAVSRPQLVKNTKVGILICSDLPTASIAYLNANNRPVLNSFYEMTGKENLIGKKTRFLHPACKTVIVPACFAVGDYTPNNVELNVYFMNSLLSSVRRVFEHQPNVNQIVVCDRSPHGELTPFNAVFSRS